VCCRLERALNFSRNDTADIDDANALAISLKNFSLSYSKHCNDAQSSTDILDLDVWRPSVAALVQAADFRFEIEKLTSDPVNMSKLLKSRASEEPDKGTCDAILVIPIPNPLREGKDAGTAKTAKFLEEFAFMRLSDDKSDSFVKVKEPQADVPSRSSSLLSPQTSTKSSSRMEEFTKQERKQLLDNPLCAARSESSFSSPFTISDLSVIDPTALFLPELIAEHKKRDEDETKALNQERTYIVSAVRFLATIGIKGHPIFGLVTSGRIGGVIMAWHSSSEDVCALFRLVFDASF
jgi:hypothetical protein